jgi:DNA recombination protein RmuC
MVRLFHFPAMSSPVTFAACVIGLVLGFLPSIYLLLRRAREASERHILQERLTSSENRCLELNAALATAQNSLSETAEHLRVESNARAAAESSVRRINSIESELTSLRAQNGKLQTQNAQLQVALEKDRQSASEKLRLFSEARDVLCNQFKALADDVLQSKASQFAQQNEALAEQHRLSLGSLLNPLKEQLGEFKRKVEDVYVQEGKDRSALAAEVRQLRELNVTLSEEAKNLTSALKGSNKTQGNYGELVLERVLEASGLRKGFEYHVQVSHQVEGKRQQPDVVIHLPEDRRLVVDSKISMDAYQASLSASDAAARDTLIKEHIASVQAHIKGLASKNYQHLYGIQSLDFVVLFMPLEPAFLLAVAHERDLFMDAWNRNVLLVSPSTLLFVVRTVAHLWRQEAQTRNAQEIAHRGAELYDKLVGFVKDFEGVGTRLKQARDDYDQAVAKLHTGKGNVIRQAELLRDLGVKPSRSLPNHLVDMSHDPPSQALPEEGSASL